MRPYEFQKNVARLLLNRQNVILQAPTGAGKTHAALLPFLNALDRKHDFPARCIYSIPMRVLATQFVEEYQPAVIKAGRNDKIKVTIQTGEQQEDKQFTGNLIFATIDQVLSSFLISPYSQSRSKANLNAGAIVSSYLVFDEFHLFDPNSTLPTTLQMLKMLKGITPFVLMTATFSQTMLKELADELDAVIVGQSAVERDEFAKLPSQNKTRFYHTVEDVLSADAVLREHQGRSLVICNTVKRARNLFEEIRQKVGNKTEVILLHSQFLTKDRETQSDSIRTHFGKGKTAGDYIVVSTQAIEVGVDMTSTVLHTELAPANAIIQRAGRCARYEGEKGDVYIYRRAIGKDGEIDDLCEKTAPYMNQAEVITKTWEAFANRDAQKPMAFDGEQAILSTAHQAEDERIIADLKATNRNHRQAMYAVMRGDKGTDARNLIRYVMSQQVTIHDNPAEVAKNPFAYPSFGLHPGTVQGLLKDWLESPHWEHANDIQAIRANEDEGAAQANDERYYAEPVIDANAGWMAQLLVVHPRLATYKNTVGFVADEGGNWIAQPDEKATGEKSRPNFTYRLETYEQHIEHVYDAFTEYWKEAEWAARELEKRCGWETNSIHKAAQLAVLLHDVGKLSKNWQSWVRKYQAAIDMPTEIGQVYAHTELQEDWQRDIERQMQRRPWHAVEGALAVAPIIVESIQDKPLAQAVMSAIARHHTAHSDNYRAFQLEPDSIQHIEATLHENMNLDLGRLWGMQQPVQAGMNTEKAIAEPSDAAAYLAYLLIVRALRRADGTGTQRGSLQIS